MCTTYCTKSTVSKFHPKCIVFNRKQRIFEWSLVPRCCLCRKCLYDHNCRSSQSTPGALLTTRGEDPATSGWRCNVRQFSMENSNSDCSLCGDMSDLAGTCRDGMKRLTDPDRARKSLILNTPTADSARYSDPVPGMCNLSASFPLFRQRNCDNLPNFQYPMSENFKWCSNSENLQNPCYSR